MDSTLCDLATSSSENAAATGMILAPSKDQGLAMLSPAVRHSREHGRHEMPHRPLPIICSSPQALKREHPTAAIRLLLERIDLTSYAQPIISCPFCHGLYAPKANGKMRKHACIVPLAALPAAALVASAM